MVWGDMTHTWTGPTWTGPTCPTCSQIHVDLVRSSKQMTGYICLRHEAGDWVGLRYTEDYTLWTLSTPLGW